MPNDLRKVVCLLDPIFLFQTLFRLLDYTGKIIFRQIIRLNDSAKNPLDLPNTAGIFILTVQMESNATAIQTWRLVRY
ncbi:MAG: hypothetical protein RLZZ292_557 [Bacteroidota bacterium]